MRMVRGIAIAVVVVLMPNFVVARQGGAPTAAKFGGGCLTLPQGYKAIVDDGPDFTVERILATDEEHGPDAWIGLYTGNFPNVSIPQGATKQPARFGTQEITWFSWTDAHEGRTYHHYEAVWVDRSERKKKRGDGPPLQHHLFVTGTDAAQVQGLKSLAESLTSC